MQFIETALSGVTLIKPDPREDSRGRFMRGWCVREFADHGLDFVPVQANYASSTRRGTIRGMHFQDMPALEAKLIRCTRGAMFDVALDLRPESRTFGQWFGAELTSENAHTLYVPERCAHGYQTLQENSEMYYLASQFYTASSARGVRFNDPVFNIQWPLPATLVSEQDRNWPLLEQGSYACL